MKYTRLGVIAATLTLLAAFFLLRPFSASAHENREVGEYEIIFGWHVEPAYAGVFNGPELRIITHDDKKPVEGLEKLLKLRVVFGNQSKELKLEPVWQDPGRYMAYVTPTRPGDYSFELTGKIGNLTIKEKFTSADGDFSSVEPASDVLFPDAKVDLAGLQAQIDALKKEIETLKAAKK